MAETELSVYVDGSPLQIPLSQEAPDVTAHSNVQKEGAPKGRKKKKVVLFFLISQKFHLTLKYNPGGEISEI